LDDVGVLIIGAFFGQAIVVALILSVIIASAHRSDSDIDVVAANPSGREGAGGQARGGQPRRAFRTEGREGDEHLLGSRISSLWTGSRLLKSRISSLWTGSRISRSFGLGFGSPGSVLSCEPGTLGRHRNENSSEVAPDVPTIPYGIFVVLGVATALSLCGVAAALVFDVCGCNTRQFDVTSGTAGVAGGDGTRAPRGDAEIEASRQGDSVIGGHRGGGANGSGHRGGDWNTYGNSRSDNGSGNGHIAHWLLRGARNTVVEAALWLSSRVAGDIKAKGTVVGSQDGIRRDGIRRNW